MTLKINGISGNEVESLGLTFTSQTGWCPLCLLLPLFGLAPSALFLPCPPQVSEGCSFLPVKHPKFRFTSHLHSFHPVFSHLANQLPQSVQSHPFLQGFKTEVHHNLRSSRPRSFLPQLSQGILLPFQVISFSLPHPLPLFCCCCSISLSFPVTRATNLPRCLLRGCGP